MRNFRNINNICVIGLSGNGMPRFKLDCEIEFEQGWQEVSYIADSTDVVDTGRAIYAATVAAIENGAEFKSFENWLREEQQAAFANHDERMKVERQLAYSRETDTLVGQVLRGEVTQAEYEAAVAAIKTRFPYLADMTLEQKQAAYPLLDFSVL